MMIIAYLAWAVNIICLILVLLKLFPAEGALKGILGIICGLYTFIWGWMNASRFNLRNIMLVWTIALIVSIVMNFVVGASAIPRG